MAQSLLAYSALATWMTFVITSSFGGRHAVAGLVTLVLSGCGVARQPPGPPPVIVADTAPRIPAPPPRPQLEHEEAFYSLAAGTAWRQFDALWNQRTGLARATADYDRLTPWDMGSVLAANFSAHKLGILDDSAYARRMRTTLATLARVPLFRNAVFNKGYFSGSGRMVGRTGSTSSSGYGWSATDLGRLLIWLHIVGTVDKEFAGSTARVAQRIKFPETITPDGYLRGGMIGSRGQLWRFQEGRIGYEQYAAQGFAFWGAAVDSALDVRKHARTIHVLGVPLPADTRGLDRLTSEPLVLLGMELGFTPEMEELAANVLAAQQARFDSTGALTMVSEDAINLAPHYFYYYCVYCNGKAFTVDVVTPGKTLDEPRWVSTKASFGYHTLMPTEYTKRVMEYVAAARGTRGWSSGVYEQSGKSTETYDLNTAAIVLEAALYRKIGRPLLQLGETN